MHHIMMTPETIKTARMVSSACGSRGSCGATQSLLDIYKLGMGVSQDDREAQKWFNLAATSQRIHF